LIGHCVPPQPWREIDAHDFADVVPIKVMLIIQATLNPSI